MRKLVLAIPLLSLWTVSVLAASQPQPDPYVAYFNQESRLASQGDVAAEVCLGQLYGSGFGVNRDAGKQFYWSSMAANEGNDDGKLGVAWDYVWGIGVTKDSVKGIAMVRELLAKGNVPAESEMGSFYEFGAGVSQDWKQAVAWYTKAAQAGNAQAQARLGIIYGSGQIVGLDPIQAQLWSDKAAQHNFDCAETFFDIADSIVYGHVDPRSFGANEIYGPLAFKFLYKDGRAEDVRLTISNGDEKPAEAWLKAAQEAKLPPWPVNFKLTDKTVGAWTTGTEESFDPVFMAAVQAAIKGAQILPKDVLLYGSKGTGLVKVSFDYLDGKASNERIVESSNDRSEDAAALAAVATAKYPPVPQRYSNKKIPLKVTLEFDQIAMSIPSLPFPPVSAPIQ